MDAWLLASVDLEPEEDERPSKGAGIWATGGGMSYDPSEDHLRQEERSRTDLLPPPPDTSVAISPKTGQVLISTDEVRLYSTKPDDFRSIPTQFYAEVGMATEHKSSVVPTPDSWQVVGRHLLAIDSSNRRVYEFDSQNAQIERSLGGKKERDIGVSVSADGRFALTGEASDWISEDGLRVWHLATGRRILAMRQPAWGFRRFFFSSGDAYAVVTSRNAPVQLLHLASGGETVELQDEGDARLARAGIEAFRDKSTEGLNPLDDYANPGERTLELKRAMYPHPSDFALARDGRTAVSTQYHQSTIRFWDLRNWTRHRTVHTQVGASAVIVTEDGLHAISLHYDDSVQIWDVKSGEVIKRIDGDIANIQALALSRNGNELWVTNVAGTALLYHLDWDYEFPDPTDWDEGARPYLENFLTLHTPYAGEILADREPTEEEITLALTRRGSPVGWREDFDDLIRDLQNAGYGWLRPEGVMAELEHMAADWTEPPLPAWLR